MAIVFLVFMIIPITLGLLLPVGLGIYGVKKKKPILVAVGALWMSACFFYWWPEKTLTKSGCQGEYLVSMLKDPAFDSWLIESRATDVIVPDKFCNSDCQAKVVDLSNVKVQIMSAQSAGHKWQQRRLDRLISVGSLGYDLQDQQTKEGLVATFFTLRKYPDPAQGRFTEADIKTEAAFLTEYKMLNQDNLLNLFVALDMLGITIPRTRCRVMHGIGY